MADSTVLFIDPNFLLLDTYSVSDENLIANQEVTSTFNPESDYVEYYIYGLNNSLLYPSLEDGTIPYSLYSLLDNDIYIDPSLDLQTYGFEQGGYNTLYNFYSNRLSSSFSTQYFISEISSDRTEIRLDSNDIDDIDIISSVTDFIAERTSDEYYPDFLLNFGSNRTVIANNIQLDGNTVLIKLYEPLPPQFNVKSTLWVVEEVSNPVAYNVTFADEILEEEDSSIQLKGPNINLSMKDQINNSTQAVSLASLDASPLTSSYQQLQSLFNEEGIQINVDYSEYSNFINFSSIQSRIENFEYKLQLIESYQSSSISGSNVPGTEAVSGSKVYYDNLIGDIITNFDGYEYFLYFTSGSKSWPKSNTEPPYLNLPTTDLNAITWYNEQTSSAATYDELNQDNLYYSIPEYLRNDPANHCYIEFVEMVGQHFDNIWIYLKDTTNKYNADNRIDAGISKDLIAQTLRDFSLKIYQNNFSSDDIYSSFLGLTPSGSLFPFPNITGSLPTPEGFEYVDTFISSSTDAIPLDDVNKRIYKRLYHNLPYLLKSKGTVAGIKTLLNIYGIPDTILRISEFGGKDKVNTNDYDYWYNKYNYAYSTGDDGNIETPWPTNPTWGAPDDVPASLQFRFKLPPSSSLTPQSQSLWTLGNGDDVRLVLEYDTTLLDSGSFDGSIADPNNQYANLRFFPEYSNNPNISADISLPFVNDGWWSVMINRRDGDFELFAANKIYNGQTGTEIGFITSSSIIGAQDGFWFSETTSYFPAPSPISGYRNFSGSYQEIRYYNTQITQDVFKDYVMNPLSFEGNTINNAPDSLMFRATLGGELYTGSTSIHPKVTGSWEPISSFVGTSDFIISNGEFLSNREYIFLDQPAVGIKNRINDKIRPVDLSLPTYTASSNALIPDANTLSNQQSIQQDKTRDDIYTNNINLLEVTFSPQNELNDDIIQQLGHFNIGDLIGDPRDIYSSNQSYPELDKLRQEYFLKYVDENYDFNDYVRLIKFFDNSLFKMIKDFVPARTSLASGITIKPTILERQKYPVPQAEWEDVQYSGSVKSFPKDYVTGSLQVTSGGDGGSFENFNHLTNFTQSWSGSNNTPSGSVPYIQSDAPEFINGEFSGSTILVEDGELNPGCNNIKSVDVTDITFDIEFSSWNPDGTINLPAIQLPFTGPPPSFTKAVQALPSGDLSIWWNSTRTVENLGAPGKRYTDTFKLNWIGISKTSKNGVDLTSSIPNATEFTLLTSALNPTITGGGTLSTTTTTLKLNVISIKEYANSYLIAVSSDAVITLVNNIPPGDPVPVPNPVVIATQNDILSILNPYIEGNFANSDCNAVIGNATDIREGTLYQDIDYSSNATTPVNFDQLISGSATRAIVPDSNYSTKRITTPRYDGSRSTSNDFNLPSNVGGLGALPNVEQDRAYFAYFNWVGGTSPEWGNGLEDRSALSVRYFIDGDSNVIEPVNDSKGVNLSITRQTFTEGETGVLAFDDESGTSAGFSNLLGEQTIFKSGKTIAPIVYSQTASISSTATGGYTGSLTFVQGDQQEDATIGDYRLTAFADGSQTFTTDNVATEFDFQQYLGSLGTFTLDAIYSPQTTSPNGVGVTLEFKAALVPDQDTGNGRDGWATATFQWYKNGSLVGNNVTVDWSNSSAVFLSYTDSDVDTSDNIQLRMTDVDYSQGGAPALLNQSFFKVIQTPPPGIGDVGPGAGTGTYWQLVGGAPAPYTNRKIKPNALMAVYGQKQQDITGSGFFGITNDFIVEVGDEIRFRGTETQTYKIVELDNTPTNGDPLHLVLDRELTISGSNVNEAMDWFLVRRYVDAPGNIIIEADKPAGGTSPGFFMPQYATKGIENNFDTVIQKLKTDQLI